MGLVKDNQILPVGFLRPVGVVEGACLSVLMLRMRFYRMDAALTVPARAEGVAGDLRPAWLGPRGAVRRQRVEGFECRNDAFHLAQRRKRRHRVQAIDELALPSFLLCWLPSAAEKIVVTR